MSREKNSFRGQIAKIPTHLYFSSILRSKMLLMHYITQLFSTHPAQINQLHTHFCGPCRQLSISPTKTKRSPQKTTKRRSVIS